MKTDVAFDVTQHAEGETLLALAMRSVVSMLVDDVRSGVDKRRRFRGL